MKNILGFAVVFIGLVACAPANTPDTLSIKHNVSFYHAASKTGKQESNIVYELTDYDKEANSSRYYMDVSSVYCSEDVCKVDTVRLFWDELGRYTKLSLRPDVKLEKGNAEDFEQQDYQKLDDILSNGNSDLASLHKDQLVAPQSGGNAVDALTGATIAIRKTDYIKGAIWTCYTLWHFANGEVVDIIRNISGKRKTVKELRSLLVINDVHYQLFALQQLTKRTDISKDTLNVIERKLEQGDNAFFNGAINYLSILSEKDFNASVTQFLLINNSELRALILENLVNNNRPINTEFYTDIAKSLVKWREYQDVKQFLNVLEQRNIENKQINEALSGLLTHENFVIARGVYWYLKQQPADNLDSQILDDFFLQHQRRL